MSVREPDQESQGTTWQELRPALLAGTAVLLALVAFYLKGLPPLPALQHPGLDFMMFLVYVVLAAPFPLSAIAFMRSEVPTLVAQLRRDAFLLGTPEESATQESHPFARRWNHFNYAIHYLPAAITTVLGVELFFRSAGDLHLDANMLTAMRCGFVGAYIYSMHLIARRYTTLDLHPPVYFACLISLTAGLAFNYVAFAAIAKVVGSSKEFDGMGAAATAVVAFALGYFPNLAIRWFGRVARTYLRERQRRSDALPLSLIDGISDLHETRLQDEGIDNVQNLATTSIRDLVVKTPYSAQEIVEWIDQAVLYLYLEPGEIESFRRAGARSVSDFHDLWRDYYVRYETQSGGSVRRIPAANPDLDQRRKAFAQQLQTTEERLDGLYCATQQGPNMDYVRTYWKNVHEVAKRARTLLVGRICGNLGSLLRESYRNTKLTTDDLLEQVAVSMFQAEAEAEADDENAVAITADALFGRAFFKRILGDLAEARRLYEQCIKKFPESAAAYNDWAWLDAEHSHHAAALQRALEHAQKAVQLVKRAAPPRSELPAYLDTLAFVYLKLDRADEAVEQIAEAWEEWKKLYPGVPQPNFLGTLRAAAKALPPNAMPRLREILEGMQQAWAAHEDAAAQVAEILQSPQLAKK